MAMSLYELRGQIELTLDMCERARPPNNLSRDSLGCQAMLKLPSVTDEKIAAFQRVWVNDTLVTSLSSSSPHPAFGIADKGSGSAITTQPWMGTRSVTCMRDVMIAHDRSQFEVYGYSPVTFGDELKSSFDVFRNTAIPHARPDSVFVGLTPTMSDDEFVKLVRDDRIDVLVEMNGFSNGHRFVAMSRRCAPVQVSFLNHTGSSHVPNVDYILADEIGIPSDFARAVFLLRAHIPDAGMFFLLRLQELRLSSTHWAAG